MRKVINVEYICEEGALRLSNTVNKKIEEGFEPYGSVILTASETISKLPKLIQTVVKYEEATTTLTGEKKEVGLKWEDVKETDIYPLIEDKHILRLKKIESLEYSVRLFFERKDILSPETWFINKNSKMDIIDWRGQSQPIPNDLYKEVITYFSNLGLEFDN